MYKRRATLRPYPPSPWFRYSYSRRHIFGLTIASFGALFYSSRIIYADSGHDPKTSTAYTDSSHTIPLNDEEITKLKLHTVARAATISGNTGIRRFDTISIPNISPRQDNAQLSSFQLLTGTSWTMFSYFDGYGGWETSNAVSSQLHHTVLHSLLNVVAKYEPPAEHTEVGMIPPVETTAEPYNHAVDRIIKDTFLAIDDNIVQKPFYNLSSVPHHSRASISAALGAALSGSSAILALYDSEPRTLKIALTGNSRAVLGRLNHCRNGQTTYAVHVLTSDQTCQNPSEVERLRALHPGEPICSDGQLFGCGVSRTFGLAAFKWSRDIQNRLHREYLGEPPLAGVETPPYLTAEPEITTIEVKPGDFMVMASHGLWDSLTNEEVVGLVGLWLNRGLIDANDTLPLTADGIRPKDLPVSIKADNTVMYSRWGAEKVFSCVDDNAAVHLARNALGGVNADLTASLLSIEPPRAQQFRKNINLTVIFFDHNKAS